MTTPEAEEFAALLKKLKGRSGRSYGVLAGRLHVSTSTLHRYCNGDAVPGEFAPVERFARLCGATADELVEVHRRWILADAARGRGKGEAAGAGGGAVAGAVAESEAPIPAPPAEPEPEPEPVSAKPEPAPEDPDPDPVRVAPAPAPSSRWRRASARTRVLLAAAAVVALTVPTAVVVDQLKETGSDAAVGPTERRSAEGKGADAVSASPDSPSPSVSASKSPSPSATAGSASPSVRSSPSASHTSGGTETGTGRPPTVTISSYNWEEPCGQYYLLDHDPKTVPPPPPPDSTRGWARALGGVDGGGMRLELTVQGTSPQAVVLGSLRVKVLSRRAPVQQSAFSMGEGCGSGIEPQSFDVDLDDSRPSLTPVAGQQGDETVPAKDFPFRVSSRDVEVFDLDAHVEGHDVSWYLELAWSSGGRTGTLRIDDGGKPFRTSSIAGRPEYYYRYDTSVWEKR
ncbi:helix-turn-helix protein [Streptomyces sp. KhCrAH-43]|uniref:helix-turn-helix domain-containing protein n=1 Tax=unclassified Streptomyces TaxID=2593676 RepID=UPI00036B5CEA|nr:helix-turn-helix transcriptional regulator [Streptomyces sp. KhCrAH-43]MYS36290.1 helix-turn-helix domain-containing protein [Streptomyces sp. SID4920]MYX70919.1 helix-turn-helix domain-containing protein [Streptomyces sp. SID8373]RAJ56069.1 helix-turn-helix protein [Streptomyces sp. KhCrAH-43]